MIPDVREVPYLAAHYTIHLNNALKRPYCVFVFLSIDQHNDTFILWEGVVYFNTVHTHLRML